MNGLGLGEVVELVDPSIPIEVAPTDVDPIILVPVRGEPGPPGPPGDPAYPTDDSSPDPVLVFNNGLI